MNDLVNNLFLNFLPLGFTGLSSHYVYIIRGVERKERKIWLRKIWILVLSYVCWAKYIYSEP